MKLRAGIYIAIVLYALLAPDAQAQDRAAQIEHMAELCRALMAKGLCAVEKSAPIPPEQRAVRWRLGRLGVVTVGDYMDVKDTGKAMCDEIARFCADWNSAHCRVVRSQFQQQ